jgi:hypothetical protein
MRSRRFLSDFRLATAAVDVLDVDVNPRKEEATDVGESNETLDFKEPFDTPELQYWQIWFSMYLRLIM